MKVYLIYFTTFHYLKLLHIKQKLKSIRGTSYGFVLLRRTVAMSTLFGKERSAAYLRSQYDTKCVGKAVNPHNAQSDVA